jgi:apolipoprotein N-acyltransferase
VITNDAWWGETNGHRQHFEFSRTRAIEQRMWVARSANTGISGFIDPLGRVYEASPYNQRGAYQYRIYAHEPYTLYYHTGDWFWLTASVLGFAFGAYYYNKSKA